MNPTTISLLQAKLKNAAQPLEQYLQKFDRYNAFLEADVDKYVADYKFEERSLDQVCL